MLNDSLVTSHLYPSFLFLPPHPLLFPGPCQPLSMTGRVEKSIGFLQSVTTKLLLLADNSKSIKGSREPWRIYDQGGLGRKTGAGKSSHWELKF